MYTCAMCKEHNCRRGGLEKLPLNCPCNEEQEIIKKIYLEDENYKWAYHSALAERQGYCQKTRLEEIIDFSNKCNFRKKI